MAWFGYTNPNPNNVRITLTSENAVYNGSVLDAAYSPPTKFIPGTVEYALSVGYVIFKKICIFY